MPNPSPLNSIRAKCLDCCCGSAYEVKLCTIPSCALYPYRFGKNPYREKRKYSEEQKQQLRERMREINEAKNHDK